MKLSILILLSLFPGTLLHAEEGQAAVPASAPAAVAKPSSEDLRKKLTATAMEELETHNKTPGNAAYSLESFFSVLERQSPESFRSMSSDANYLQTSFPGGPGFAKSKELAKAYVEQLKFESAELRRKYEAECTSSVAALLKRATETGDPEKLVQLSEELEEFFKSVSQKAHRFDDEGGYRIPDMSTDQSNIRNFVSQIIRFHTQRMEEQWGGASNSLLELRRLVPKITRYLPVDEAKAFITNSGTSIGLLPPDQMQRLFDATVSELFDDANQDRMDAIQGTIRKQQELGRSALKPGFSEKWQALAGMATSFAQDLTRVRQGGAPQFSPEQWFRSNSDAAVIISREKLIDLLKRYQVRVKDETGEVRQVAVYYDLNEVIARIQSPADIARELPVFNKAVRQASYAAEGAGNWQNLGQRLQQYADLFAKLESGVSFALASFNQAEYGGYERSNIAGSDDAASRKAAGLNQQLQWMILQRFYPEVVIDPKSSPARVVADLFAGASKRSDYQAMLTLGQLSGYLVPGQALLNPQDCFAVSCYLNGVKQEEQLDQPRLATYYFQRAAAVPSSPIPPSEFKARLKALKQNAPKDYDQGTDDALEARMDATAQAMPGTLMVPAKPAAPKGAVEAGQ